MNPIRTIIEIRYKDPAQQFTFISGIIRAVGGTPPAPSQLLFGGSVQIRLKDKKIMVFAEPRRFALNIEENMTLDQLKGFINDMAGKINNHLQWGQMQRIGIRTFWIKEVSDFDTLVTTSKGILFKENSLLNEATDVALPLTLINGSEKINYNFGPMKKEQLIQQPLNFKDVNNIPDVFAFIDTDYYGVLDRNFSKNYFRDFMNRAFEVSEKKVDDTLSILKI